MRQYAVELHSHTNHSDGDFTVAELHRRAKEYGYDGLILTDHNTSSGYPELAKLAAESGLVTLSGIEWTTYFGHMLVHDANWLVDWRTAQIDTIDDRIQEVKDAGGLVGIAHPYAMGSPMCTGCHWSYEVKNWNNVDYIEIWNASSPDEHFWSWSAYELWSRLLDQGYRLSCGAGRDWHRLEPVDCNPAITYLEMTSDLDQTRFRQALEKGSFYISLGPGLDWHVEKQGRTFTMGDCLVAGEASLQIEALPVRNETLQRFSPEVHTVKVIHNGNISFESTLLDEALEIPLSLETGYVRVELWGSIKDKPKELLTISNPIYIK